MSIIRIAPIVGIAVIALLLPVYGQISTPCTPSQLASFTPCMNFITNSTGNGTSPTAACCNALKNLTSNSMDCACLIFTGGVPFQVPINRTMVISLPRACNVPGVPLQCKASGAPVASPGPASLGPVVSPAASPPASPTLGPVLSPATPTSSSPSATVVPEPTPSAQPPESDTTPVLTPPSSTTQTGAPPTSSTGIHPVLTPPSSTSAASYSISPSFLLLALGFVIMKYH